MYDIRKYFVTASTSGERESTTDTAEGLQHSEDDSDGSTPGPSEMVCTESSGKYNRKWEKSFTWLHYDEDVCGAFCSVCLKWANPSSTLKRCLGRQAFY